MMLPALVAAVAVALAGTVSLPPFRVPLRRRRDAVDVGATARMLLIGLSAGLSLASVMEVAADELGPEPAAELRAVLRRSRVVGLATALATADGFSRRLFHRLARAHMTGAPTIGTIAAFIEEHRTVQRAEVLERLRRLPVTLTVPLALLILPGFVLLTLGPTVANIVQQLVGGLL
ncbi:MAG: hypothetical protein GWP04_05460 [Gammaproteobacteria bacterium]|nr:hypothetical protein [Gammaproteobacteria bacterium]